MADLTISATQPWNAASERITVLGAGTSNTDAVILSQIAAVTGYTAFAIVTLTAGSGGFYTGNYASHDLAWIAARDALNSAFGTGMVLGKGGTMTFANPVPMFTNSSANKIAYGGLYKRGLVINTPSNAAAFSTIGSAGTFHFDARLMNMEIRGSNNAANTSNYGVSAQFTDNLWLDNVYFRQCYHGANIDDCTNVLINGQTTFRDNKAAGLYVTSTTGVTSEVTIDSATQFERSQSHNIHIAGGTNIRVKASKIVDAGAGIGVVADGIYIDASTNNITNLRIMDNFIYDTRVGGARTQRYGINYTVGSGTITGLQVALNNVYNNVTGDYAPGLENYADIFMTEKTS